jgi:hypothetical protein
MPVAIEQTTNKVPKNHVPGGEWLCQLVWAVGGRSQHRCEQIQIQITDHRTR